MLSVWKILSGRPCWRYRYLWGETTFQPYPLFLGRKKQWDLSLKRDAVRRVLHSNLSSRYFVGKNLERCRPTITLTWALRDVVIPVETISPFWPLLRCLRIFQRFLAAFQTVKEYRCCSLLNSVYFNHICTKLWRFRNRKIFHSLRPRKVAQSCVRPGFRLTYSSCREFHGLRTWSWRIAVLYFWKFCALSWYLLWLWVSKPAAAKICASISS